MTSSDDGSARLWSVETGFELTKIMFETMDDAARSNVLSQLQSSIVSQDGPVSGAALSPDNALIATCGFLDHSICVWNAKTGQRIDWPKSAVAGHISTVTSMQFCDKSMLLTSSLDGSVRLWAALTGQMTKVFDGQACVCVVVQSVMSGIHEQPQFFMELSETVVKSIVVTSQHEAMLATLSLQSSHAPAIPFGQDCGGVTDAVFSPTGLYFAASHENGSCTVHSSAAGARLWQLIGHKGRANCVVFAGSDRFIISSGCDKLVLFWQLPAVHSKSDPLIRPLFSLPFDIEIARIGAVCNSLVFASVDSRTSSRLPCACSDGVLNLGGSLSLFFDAGALKYLSAELDAGPSSKMGLNCRYLLPPVWIIESILASSHVGAREKLRCLLEGPAAGMKFRCILQSPLRCLMSNGTLILGAIALHERLSRPSLLSSLASKGNTESLSFLLGLHAPGIPFLIGRCHNFVFHIGCILQTSITLGCRPLALRCCQRRYAEQK